MKEKPRRKATPDSILQGMLDDMASESIKPAVLLAELDDLLRSKPNGAEIADTSDNVLAWRGRVAAVLNAWDRAEASKLIFIDGKINGRLGQVDEGYRELISLLHQARHTVQMRTLGPMSIAVEKGAVFDYFDELRKIIERASSEVLFVDPYLDAEFVSRYLPHIQKGVRVRLLTSAKKLATLLPAVEALAAQSGTKIEVRTIGEFHDRYVFVDGKECYQSGTSFKEGAKNSPTTVAQITDAFDAMAHTYEELWKKATILL